MSFPDTNAAIGETTPLHRGYQVVYCTSGLYSSLAVRCAHFFAVNCCRLVLCDERFCVRFAGGENNWGSFSLQAKTFEAPFSVVFDTSMPMVLEVKKIEGKTHILSILTLTCPKF